MKHLLVGIMIIATGIGCSKNKGGGSQDPPPPVDTAAFDIDKLADTYASLSPFAYYTKWGPYNVHDPSIIKSGDHFYSYSTDAAYGLAVRPGIQVRKSKDLVDWQFVGWAFNGLPAAGANFITQAGGIPNQSLWAPYVLKVGDQFRLYYSLASNIGRLSVIGLATASAPEGPWTEQGIVVVSRNDAATQTNAIDPSVVVTRQGEHWLYYGSAWDGIYVMKLNAGTGLAAVNNDKGVRIAQRGFTGPGINGNIEAPEIIYNAALNKYYLFISYDWLETKYNVRVGRSSSPQGPFLDFNGRDLNLSEDHGPMILAPYQFQGHGGWQGVAHCSVFENNGQYFMAHQGRPSVDKYFMVMHVRKLFWTADGWPVVSPERYAGVADAPVTDVAGEWELIVFNYRVVPGYAAEQVAPDLQTATTITLAAGNYTYNAPWLEFAMGKVLVHRERDWENKRSTIVFSGLSNTGTAIWGKKK